MDDSSFYPPVGFYFEVDVGDITGKNECNFQEVSGLNVSINLAPIKEGGENRFIHRLPERPTHQNLILKRGMVKGSPLITWIKNAIEQFTFSPKTVIVKLLDETGAPLVSWTFDNAYPVAAKISDFKAQENSIVIETFELAYNYFTRKD